MRKIFSVFVCTVLLAFSSIASADMFTSTITFHGKAGYLADKGEPVLGPFYGGAVIWASGIYDLPNPPEAYDWTASLDLSVKGKYKKESDDDWKPIHINVEDYEIPLGQFALTDPPLPFVKRTLERLANDQGYFPRLGLGYIHRGTWEEGFLALGITRPLGDLEAAFMCFKGELELKASSIPEPKSMLLFGTGLVGLAGVARVRMKKK